MKTKTNKKISTIVLTAIMVLSVFAAFVTPASATTVTLGAVDDTYGTAVWETNPDLVDPGTLGDYSVKLDKAAGDAEGSVYVQFVPATGITLANFAGDVDGYSFYYLMESSKTSGPQFELRFEDPASTGWVEITAVGLQATPGTATWDEEILATTTSVGYGGNTPNGESVFVWTSPLTTLDGILATVNAKWEATETGKTVDDYELTRVRVELYEAGVDTLVRHCYIDDITINDVTYELEKMPYNVIIYQEKASYALIGQELHVMDCTDLTTLAISGKEATDTAGQYFTASVDGSDVATFDTSVMTIPGSYDMGNKILGVSEPTLTINTLIGTTSISSTIAGTNVTLKVTTNLAGNDKATIELKDPDGNILTRDGAGDDLTEITMVTIKDMDFSTYGFTAGTYTIQVKTDSTVARGLSCNSNIASLEIVSAEIDISASKTSVVENQKTTFTITAPADHAIDINVTPTGRHAMVEANYNDIGTTLPDGRDITNITSSDFQIPNMPADSTFAFTMSFDKDGTYTVKATDGDESASVDIAVSKGAVTVSAPTTAVIGEKVEITGTATGTDNVNIQIKDSAGEVKDTAVRPVSDGEYTYKWNTGSPVMLPGTYKIYVYSGEVVKDSADAAASIRLAEGDLVVSVPSVTADADTGDMKVEGTATGATEVSMLVFRNDNGACQFAEPVTVKSDDWSFEETPLLTAATKGTYTVFVIHPGRDATTKVIEGDDTNVDYSGKTLTQITSLVEYWSIGQPGSDDMLETTTFKVEDDTVTISPVADVGVGATLTIEATTNRAEGKLATVTLTGPDGTIALASTEVTDGEVTADFDTTGFALGEWEVEVDVDGTVETTTVNILEAAPTPTPTVTPTPTPTPTVTPTVTPPTPGFEAVFAIAGLLAVAYLVLRREE